MTPLLFVLAGSGMFLLSGALALALGRSIRAGAWVAVAGAVSGGLVGVAGAIASLHGGWSGELSAAWEVPGGALVVGVDPLSAFFLAPLFVVGALCAVYGRRYMDGASVPAAELNFLLAAMVLVLVARHAIVFLLAWETMTLLAYLLVTRDHDVHEVRRAGWVYLIASHVAIVILIALFVGVAGSGDGDLGFAAIERSAPPAWAATGFMVLALIGFGIKAGVGGLHVWLPEAHAAAPSHVSALMSGVLIKLGLYGILRFAVILCPEGWFGITLMVLGVAGALAGIVLALTQRDLKRVLAYSSVENVGIIVLCLGVGFWARAGDNVEVAAVAFAGGLLHVWNHALMKSLMFLGAGSVLHAAGTKDMERLGGLLRRMPWTGASMILGAVAIAGLPPLNGLTSEWLLYRSLADVGVGDAEPPALAAMGAAAAVALVGGLAVLCFTRLVGTVLLGVPRSSGASRTHESPLAMVAPMAVLAIGCVATSLAAPYLVSLHGALLVQLEPAGAAAVGSVPDLLRPLVAVHAVLLAAIAAAAAVVIRRSRRAQTSDTWGCGYAAPTARMQYTARAFAELLTSRVVPRWLRGREQTPSVEGPFPRASAFHSSSIDPLTRGVYEPLLVRWGHRFSRLRFLQQGNVHVYMAYIVATAIAALAWVALRDWVFR
jgi:hydrogenase-4 component B